MFSANTLRSDCSSVTIMYPLEETTAGSCSGCQQQHPHGILYGILSGQKVPHLDCTTAASNCHCEQRTVCLKDPKTTCLVASNVLVKTMRFLRSLPSFRQLPQGDQLVLLEYSWVPLFVLGLAQDKILFEVTDRPSSSLLRKILLGPGGSTEKEVEQPTLRDVCKLRSCLHQLWNLDLSPKEYAYLKGALLFNPAVRGLDALFFIESLQQEAHCALHEVIGLVRVDGSARFNDILVAAATLQTFSHSLVTELFFQPVLGNANMMHLLMEMLR